MEYRKIYQGHALEVMKTWPDNVVDCLITSPPYWGLRNYGTNPVVWDGQPDCDHEWGDEIKIGQTSAQTKYQAAEDAFTQVSSKFCLKCGAWLGELGGEPSKYLFIKHLCDIFDEVRRILKPTGVCFININDTYVDKSLAHVPFLFCTNMCDRDWYHRNTIIWHKPNALPQSVKDRFTVDYEYVFFFAAEKNYYFKQSEIIEPYSDNSDPYEEYDGQAIKDYDAAKAQNPSETKKRILEGMAERGGRNKRCVWSITTKPFSEAHFAVFPPNLLEPMIKAGCPPDGVVFDPFIGSGTVGIVAEKFNRKWIGIELNEEFIELAEKRIHKEAAQGYLEGIFDD